MVFEREALIIYSSKNVKGKKDATGAFIPEAKAFVKVNGIPESNMLAVPCVGMKANKRRKLVLDFLNDFRFCFIDMIAWFGHGYSSGIQFGFNNKNVDLLIKGLTDTCVSDVRQVLYACSTASTNKNTRNIKMPGTEGGFADVLRDSMVGAGFEDGWIDGHLQPGHTTKNPYIVRFECDPQDTLDGNYLIEPKTELWKPWVKAVQKTDFRFKFPYMTEDQIRAYLVEQ